MHGLDPVIHQPARLRIMSALASLAPGEPLEFTRLRDLLELSDGNLGAHLRRLEAAGYVELDKVFVERKPRTRVAASTAGREAFLAHVRALEEVLRGPALEPAS